MRDSLRDTGAFARPRPRSAKVFDRVSVPIEEPWDDPASGLLKRSRLVDLLS
jgi:hypothetical protein